MPAIGEPPLPPSSPRWAARWAATSATTSAFFGGKGKSLNFYETGRELFDVMCEMETAMDVKAFFVMDENFLLNRERAMDLLVA